MKFNTRQIILTAVAAALVTPAAFAGQGINRHQTERVVRNSPFWNFSSDAGVNATANWFRFNTGSSQLASIVLNRGHHRLTTMDSFADSIRGGSFTLAPMWAMEEANTFTSAASLNDFSTNGNATVDLLGPQQFGSAMALNLTPVPEPSTWIGAALALLLIGWMQRRRIVAFFKTA